LPGEDAGLVSETSKRLPKASKVEVSENQFGKYTEKLSEISEEADASVEVWVRLRSNKKNDPYRH
jgi:Asp-tRNA(Asn)/Glu-tRNA(Gln) amidotransferase C subunit